MSPAAGSNPERLDDIGTALSTVPAAGSRRGQPAAGVLKFFHGPMDCGKSTLALQLDHNHARQGRRGLLLTRLDRSRQGRISSRMGLSRPAVEVDEHTDLAELVRRSWAAGRRVDYLIVDEVQFFEPWQIDQLSVLADEVQVDVYAFGITTDFRGRLFPATARLFELADETAPVQVEVLCWCGRPGRFNARVVAGELVRTGETVVVADVHDPRPGRRVGADEQAHPADPGESAGPGDPADPVDARQPADQDGPTAEPGPADVAVPPVRYQVLCRTHHRTGDLGPTSEAALVILV